MKCKKHKELIVCEIIYCCTCLPIFHPETRIRTQYSGSKLCTIHFERCVILYRMYLQKCTICTRVTIVSDLVTILNNTLDLKTLWAIMGAILLLTPN